MTTPTTYSGPERRELDRSQPAAKVTVHMEGRAVHWVRAGSTEIPARDAAEQRHLIALHNILNHHSTGVTDLRETESEATDD